jgi:hypothetical protein
MLFLRSRCRFSLLSLMAAIVLLTLHGRTARSQDLLNDTIDYSNFTLNLRPYFTMQTTSPFNTFHRNIISMTTRPGESKLYVTTQDGYVTAITENANGTTSASTFFNVGAAITAAGRTLSGSANQAGLQSIAFHPDFNRADQPGYGKIYASFLAARPANPAGYNYLGNSVAGSQTNPEGVLAEWTYNPAGGTFSGYRELFRTKMPANDHPIKQARFNSLAAPGDEDYGLLYMTHGDSNQQHSPGNFPSLLDNALGKMIRINPLEDGANRYTIPATNPFATSSDPNVLKEIYAYGFRNPHTYSFNRDDNGQVRLLVGDIGRANIEEINLVENGGNYGWTNRDGTFVHTGAQVPDRTNNIINPTAGYYLGVAPLPANEATVVDQYGRPNIYPVAQYDHDATAGTISNDSAIASGFVIRNGSDPNLHNQLFFSDFTNHANRAELDPRPAEYPMGMTGDMFHADFNEMLSAVTKLDANDSTRDEPGELTQAVIHKLKIALDADNNPATPAVVYNDFNELISPTAVRNDVRYGEGAFGQMFISSKVTGIVYLVTNSVAVPGDFDADGAVTGDDFLLWQRDLGKTYVKSPADANRDEVVDAADLAIWKANVGKSWGDPPAITAVPEPGGLALAVVAALGLGLNRKRMRRS